MEFHKATLDNGLEIVAECNEEAHSTAVGFFVKTGARDETDAISGVSHFLEHMVFKGTPSRSADDVNRKFDEMGAHYNAFTSEENTVYYAAVLPEHLEPVVDLWADVMRPSLREEDFETEKKVILEEIQMYDDQPPFGGDDKCKAAFFGKHPLHRSVLGTVQSITNLSAGQMYDYFRARYCPKNIAVVAAGRVDFDGLVACVKRACGGWEPFDAGRSISPAEQHEDFLSLHKEAATQEYVIELALGPSATDDRRYAAKVAAIILGDDGGSRLYWELVDPGIAEQASLGHADYDGTGLFMTYLSCEPDRCAEILQRVLDLYRKVSAEGVTQDELAQAMSKINSRVVLAAEKPPNRLFRVGSNWLQRQEYRTVKEELDRVNAVSVDDVAEVLAAFPLTASTTMTIGPLAEIAPPK